MLVEMDDGVGGTSDDNDNEDNSGHGGDDIEQD